MLTAHLLDGLPHVRHGFFTRQGGYSTGVFESLNCGFGSGDNPEVVQRNRDECAGALGVDGKRLVTVFQQHTANVVTVTEPWPANGAPVADAMVTNRPNIAIGVLAADCAPVLLADPDNGIVGVAHAGWKGALTGVIEQTVEAMLSLGAQVGSLMAVVGPSIGRASYEVGPEFRQRFLEDDEKNTSHFSPVNDEGKCHFDLQEYVLSRIECVGVTQIEPMFVDTCADQERFFSYRRSCLHGDSHYGRQLSSIALSL